MKRDGVLDGLILSRDIPFKEDNRTASAKRDMVMAIKAMKGASESSPMRRGSCDDWGGCPFAPACWNATPASPADLPRLYRIREQDKPVEAQA